MLSLFAAIKARASMILGVVSALLAALLYRERAKNAEDKFRQSEGARAVERNANKALIDGIRKENDQSHANIDPNRRTHFE